MRFNGDSGTIWILSEVFYPEETGTAHYITGIGEHLALRRKVSVLCVQPSYSRAGILCPRTESHAGMEIYRCGAFLPMSGSLLARAIKVASVTLSLMLNAMFRVRRGDKLLAVTNPPTLPVIAGIMSALRGVPYSLVVHDIYPD